MIVDAHHHLWNLEREALPWMTDEHAAIRRTFEPDELEPLLARVGVSQTVLVQAACSDPGNDLLLEYASARRWIGGVVAWVDLRGAEQARRRLDQLAAQPKLRGLRHLIHDERDPHWILRDDVLESLALLADRGLILELPCVYPRHLGDVPELAASFPELTIVIDHLGKPPLLSDAMDGWAMALRGAAGYANVAAKISGLNTMLPSSDWGARDLRTAVEVAVEAFGPDRLVCGSDWPVALLNGSYDKVWIETRRLLDDVAPLHAEQLLAGNAVRLYDLDEAVAPALGGLS